MAGAFQRLADTRRRAIEISIDGDNVQVLEGDTLLTAILLHHDHLRLSDIGEEPRAGFCLMGACQDCWVSESNGRRLRACTTYVRPGLAIVTGRPSPPVVETATRHAAASDPVETPAKSDALPADGDAL
jgi:predicted molibdopterin-dependent oxidoreductase YjgC